jgi:hypothetical protein
MISTYYVASTYLDLSAITNLSGRKIGWWQTSLSSLTPASGLSETRHFSWDTIPPIPWPMTLTHWNGPPGHQLAMPSLTASDILLRKSVWYLCITWCWRTGILAPSLIWVAVRSVDDRQVCHRLLQRLALARRAILAGIRSHQYHGLDTLPHNWSYQGEVMREKNFSFR